ncbi:hypothetical protein TWF481_000505 [Arthrobotrys musiformis]|uniref:Uncharacterized protein n=1 Tax=Arthrobotrys musiformis TaxID=47236 RepID=A0AAV9WMR4_9PEZI
MLLIPTPPGPLPLLPPMQRTLHMKFLQKTQEDCNKLAERFRTYCSHTQHICRELTNMRSWNTYQEEKLLIAREAELLHMYCQLSDEVVRIRKHMEEVGHTAWAGCDGDINPACRCWMASKADSANEVEMKKKKEFGGWEFSVPDGKRSFLDNKEEILAVGRRAENAVYIVIRGPEELPASAVGDPQLMMNLVGENALKFYEVIARRTGKRLVEDSYFTSD